LAAIYLAGVLILFLLADLSGPFLYPRPVEYRQAGLALQQQISPGAAILTRKRQIPFYAGGVWVWLPFTDLAGVLAHAKRRRIDYIALDQYTTPSLRPQLAYLLDPTQAPANLSPIYMGNEVVVYRITQ
jgi:hypothetical protein